jgi:hypothetical protein
MMRVNIAANHGGFILKEPMAESLPGTGYDEANLGAHQLNSGTHHPDFNILLPMALAPGQVRIDVESLNTNGVTFELWCCVTRAYISAFEAQRLLTCGKTKHTNIVAAPRYYSFVNAVLTFFHRTLRTRP